MNLNAVNSYGVPLHACNDYRCDEHWWSWLRNRIRLGDYGPALKNALLARLGPFPGTFGGAA